MNQPNPHDDAVRELNKRLHWESNACTRRWLQPLVALSVLSLFLGAGGLHRVNIVILLLVLASMIAVGFYLKSYLTPWIQASREYRPTKLVLLAQALHLPIGASELTFNECYYSIQREGEQIVVIRFGEGALKLSHDFTGPIPATAFSFSLKPGQPAYTAVTEVMVTKVGTNTVVCDYDWNAVGKALATPAELGGVDSGIAGVAELLELAYVISLMRAETLHE